MRYCENWDSECEDAYVQNVCLSMAAICMQRSLDSIINSGGRLPKDVDKLNWFSRGFYEKGEWYDWDSPGYYSCKKVYDTLSQMPAGLENCFELDSLAKKILDMDVPDKKREKMARRMSMYMIGLQRNALDAARYPGTEIGMPEGVWKIAMTGAS